MKPIAVLAVDAGGSKVDVAAIARDGSVLGCRRILTGHEDGHDPAHLDHVAVAIELLVRDLDGPADDGPIAPLGVFCLAGADLPIDDRRILRVIDRRGWTRDRLLRNDTFAVLRAGTERTWGVGVVCGYGTNCSAVAPDGRTFRLPALGWIAGDWGGGSDIGQAAVWHAMRSQDGRGERTTLEGAVPAYFGLRRPRQLMEAMYLGRLAEERVAELPPLVFRAARGGDAVARSILERQSDEVVTMATTAIRRLRMTRLDPHVVLGGGLFRTPYAPFIRRIEEGVRVVAPSASVAVLERPPVLGAALLGLDRIDATVAAKRRVHETLTHERLGRARGRREEG